ncbi:hypothetical protein LJK87_05980 [Paenibacillus sp. P25]|nr:hypothetical protein LJK87_05980 [Paenibacillus sp. P25]
MKPNANTRFIDYFEYAMYLLAVICFIYFFLQGNRPKMLEPVLIAAVLAGIRALVRWTRIEMFPALRISVLAFIFITMFLANEFNFYSLVPYMDKIEHVLSGGVLFYVGSLILMHITKDERPSEPRLKTAVYFSLYFSVAMAGPLGDIRVRHRPALRSSKPAGQT